MIVSAHQPHYLPWLGYLAKIAASDLFVVMDDLQYEAQNFQNRNRVKIAHGPAWLTVPLERDGQATEIRDKRIANESSPKQHWQRRHFETLRNNYSSAPFWKLYEAALQDAYARPWSRLIDLQLHMLMLHLGWFAIKKPIVLASSLSLSGTKTDRLASLCHAVNADVYLSGGGGSKGYLDEEKLRRLGVRVEWQTFNHPRYPQRHATLGFVSHLAALDLLLNCGPDDSRAILRDATVLEAQPPRAAVGAR
jgi:hypothetical protein